MKLVLFAQHCYAYTMHWLRVYSNCSDTYPTFICSYDNPDGYVFCQENGSPYEPRTYQDLFKRCIRQAGIADANFHSLRHTFATRSLEQGMNVVTLSRLLGHANPSITVDKYGHALDDHKRDSVAKLGDIYSARPSQKDSIPAPQEIPAPMEMKMGW